jgi:hypothetical protein
MWMAGPKTYTRWVWNKDITNWVRQLEENGQNKTVWAENKAGRKTCFVISN